MIASTGKRPCDTWFVLRVARDGRIKRLSKYLNNVWGSLETYREPFTFTGIILVLAPWFLRVEKRNLARLFFITKQTESFVSFFEK